MSSDLIPAPSLLPVAGEFIRSTMKIIETGTVMDVTGFWRQAEALRKVAEAARAGLELQNAFAEQRLRLERRLGEMLTGRVSRGRPKNLLTEENFRLADLGISHNQSAQAQRIAAIPQDRFEAYFQEAREAGWEITATGMNGLLIWAQTDVYPFNHPRDGWAANGHRTTEHDARYYAARADGGRQADKISGGPTGISLDPAARPWLIRGDCLEAMEQIPSRSISLILSDPPFGLHTAHSWNTPLDLQRLWQHYCRVIRPNHPIVLFAAQPFATDLIVSARDLFRFDMIWLKSRCANFVKANSQPLRNHELILVFF